MAEANQARAVEVEATVMGQKVYVTHIHASISTGASSWPNITMTIYPPGAEKQALKPTHESIIQDMAEWQRKMFSVRDGAEVTIKISVKNDPDAGVFSFRGFITGPEYNISGYGMISLSIKCIPEYAQVDAMTYSIYTPPVAAGPLQSMCNLTNSGTICNYINDKQRELRTKYTPDFSAGEVDRTSREAQHTLNNKVVKYFEELLTASDSEECFGWTDILENLKRNDKNLTSTINQLLITTIGPFCGVIDKTAEVFGCLYVPTWENIGYFKNKYNLMQNPEPLEVDTIGMGISAVSGYGLLPPGYVGVMSPYYTHTALAMGETTHFVCYPKEHAQEGVGALYQTMGPVWVNDIVVAAEMAGAEASAAAASDSGSKRKKGADPDNVQEVIESDTESKEQEAKAAASILEKWGKSTYINISLAKSTVSMNIPLTFKPQVGKYYAVRTKEGTELFTGLLSHMNHAIQVAQNNAHASTQLEFTHVQLHGFELPYAN